MHDPLNKTKTIISETVQDITNQVTRSSARRCYKATLAAVAAFTAICQRVRAAAAWVAVLELLDLEDSEGTDGDGPHTRLTRTVVLRPDYKQSPWANMLRNRDLLDPTSRAAKLFRRRFRVPQVLFLTLVLRVIEEGWFPTAELDVVVGRPCIPVTLKVSNITQYLLSVDSGVDNSAVDMNDSSVAVATTEGCCTNALSGARAAVFSLFLYRARTYAQPATAGV